MRLRDLASKRVVIWGAAREGAAVVRAALRLGLSLDIRIIDELPGVGSLEGVTVHRGVDTLFELEQADVIIRSPGVSRYRPELQQAEERGAFITTPTNLWFAEGYKNVIAVTGTKGKSTTSSLIAHLLKSVDKRAVLAGNIGQAPIDFVDVANPDWWVLELSSFQTADLDRSPDIGVLTTLSAEHLDWHGDFEHYRNDKLNLFAHNPSIVVVANVTDPGVAAVVDRLPNIVPVSTSTGVCIKGNNFTYNGEVLFPLQALQLVGRHNVQLACVALTAVAQTGIDVTASALALRIGLQSFEALPHRLSPVAEHHGVVYIDDGLATTPIATMAALDAFEDRPTTILLGGHDRGVPYEDLGRRLAASSCEVRIVTMPANGERIAAAVQSALSEHPNPSVTIRGAVGLEDAVCQASVITPPGGVVLLSPAAASFGAFRDYVERSDAFCAAVHNITQHQ